MKKRFSPFIFIIAALFFFAGKSFAGKDYVGNAKAAIAKGDYQAALSSLRDAYEDRDNRKKYDVNFLFASTFYNLDMTDSAIMYYIRAREISPDSFKIYLGLGDTYIKKNLALPAIQQFEKAISYDSSQIPVYMKIAKLYRVQRDYKNAAAAYLQVVKRDPANTEPLDSLAELYTRANQFGNAARMFQRLATLRPNDMKIQLSFMRALINAKSTQEAIPVAEAIITKDSMNIEVHRILANAYYDLHNFPSGEKEYLFLQAHDSLSSDEILKLAKSQNYNKKQLDAIKTFEKFLTNRPLDSSLVEVYATLGTLYMANQVYDSAVIMFENRIRFDSAAISAYINAGICEMQLKAYKSAIPFFETVIAKKPEYIKGHLNLARCYALQNDYDNEGSAYKKMVETIADSTDKYKPELSEAFGFDGFINFFRASQIKDVDKKEEQDKLYAKGVSSLKVALTYDSASIGNNLMLGQLYQNMNKKEDAIKQYNIVLKLDPKNKEAQKGKEALKNPPKEK